MPKQPKRYYLTARKGVGVRPIWYVRFRDEQGVIGSALSTYESDRDKAEQWAVERLLAGNPVKARKPRVSTFEDWAAPWWRFETCPYIREKLANGYNISKAYARVRRSYLDQHLIPEFGKFLLSQLRPGMFRDYKMRLFNEGKLSPATINRILGTARVMFNYAVSMGELESNAVAPVKELKETPKERGILTLVELAALLGPDALKPVWHGELRHYALNLLAASTGMRLGECQALRVENIKEGGFIDVAQSWDDKYGLSAPKWGSRRYVPVPNRTASAIESLLAMRRWGEPRPSDVIFWGQDRNTPITKTAILKQFKVALSRIGITEEERARRVLLFHSYRHGFNTMVRGKVPDEQLRRVTGHKTLAMSDNYDHAGPENLADVRKVQEGLFSVPKT
jgi:integrase